MNIALCHFRVGETDGVFLEMKKWKTVLEKMGHNVYLVGGNKGLSNAHVIPELFHNYELNNKISKNAFVRFEDFKDEAELKSAIMDLASKIAKKLKTFVKKQKIDLLVPNNIWSSWWGIAAGIAFYGVAKKLEIRCIGHHHDFYWEREVTANPTCKLINDYLENYFPPKDDLIDHVVINKIAEKELYKRKRIEATIIPNVFDFEAPLWKLDSYNKDFRKAIGISDNDILVLQATRVTDRKAIELGIDVVAQIQAKGNLTELSKRKLYNGKVLTSKSKIVYVLAGMLEGSPGYVEKLKQKAADKNVNMILVNDIIEYSRCEKDKKKCYSLWDSYVHADIVMYPSILEGWGNQFLEAIFAKKPIIIYEYPVYQTDLAYKEFDVISLGKTHMIDKNGLVTVDKRNVKNAAKQAIKMLTNVKMRDMAAERNFDICKKFYSLKNLEEILNKLI